MSDFCNRTSSYFDLETALNAAKPKNKFLLIYFNSIACVNCRSFEERVLFDSKIINQFSENFVFTVLFTDVRCPLPNDNVTISKITGKELKTVGAYNSELQITLTQTSSQPHFSIIDTDKKVISIYKGDLNSVDEFQRWLSSNSN